MLIFTPHVLYWNFRPISYPVGVRKQLLVAHNVTRGNGPVLTASCKSQRHLRVGHTITEASKAITHRKITYVDTPKIPLFVSRSRPFETWTKQLWPQRRL